MIKVLLGAAAAVGVLAGCGTTTVQAVSTPSASAAAPAGATSTAKPAQAATSAFGTTYRVTGTDDNGNPTVYEVALVKLKKNAQPDNSFDAASAGKRLVGAEFKIKGIKGNSTDDANNDADLKGNNSEVYQPAFDGLAAGTNFNSGTFNVQAGAAETGWVSFEVPDHVKVSAIQWNPSSGFGGSTATWTVAP
jgi:hypothetical protein